MLDELIAEQQFKQVRDADRGRLALESEARALYGATSLRTRVAGAFVTIGGWLDRGAIERAAKVARPVHRGRVLR